MAFDFRSGLIWMWWFLQRFAAKKIKKKLQLKNDAPNVENGNRSITYKNLENIVGRFAQYIDAVDLDDLVAGMD